MMSITLIRLRPNVAKLTCDSSTHNSLLDVLEAYQVKIEIQCRSGYCGACRIWLLDGKVKYNQEPLAFLRNGEILPCCCLPIDNLDLQLINDSRRRK